MPLPQESVWDYPRPPRLEPVAVPIRLLREGHVLVETAAALRILETSHPPVYYLPPEAFPAGMLTASTARSTFCEFKGAAAYWDLILPNAAAIPAAGWSYPKPVAAYAPLAGHVALYASLLAQAGVLCTVDGVAVDAQPGDFYGGWITPNLRGPFKGAPGTRGW